MPSTARTRAVPRQPASSTEQRPVAGRPRRLLAAVGSVALIAAVIVGAWWLRQDSGESAPPVASDASTDLDVVDDPGGAARPEDAPSGDAEPADQFSAWSAELARLDGIRQRAYAARDAGLLAGVYAGPLLDADAVQLVSVVPLGCGLIGASSHYVVASVEEAVIASAEEAGAAPAQRRVVVTATATLAAGTLMCDGAARGVSAGIEPTALRIVLAPGDDGLWRISEERRA